jgi:DNA polymerase elongation subunit (family B)
MINIEQKFGTVHISYYGEDGGIMKMSVNIPESQKFQWVECEPDDPRRDKEFVSHQNVPVKKEKAKGLNKYRMIEFIDSFSDEVKAKIFSTSSPKKWFMDIETEVIDGFPDTTNPKERVLANAFCDQKGNGFVTGLIKLSLAQKQRLEDRVNDYFADIKDESLRKKYKIQYKYYNSEALMLSDLFYTYIPKMPMLTGWNFLKFDWDFLVNRCRKIGVNPEKSSPTGSMFTLSLKDKYNPTITQKIEIPMHRAVVDYMAIFEKWDTSMKFKTSLNLDYVGKEILGLQKVSYTGTLMDLYHNDYETYLYYNMVDTILVALIDEKLQTFNTMLTIASEGGVQLHDAAFASVVIESLFSKFFYAQKKVFVKKDIDRDDSTYDGGFVLEPGKGIKNDVTIFDYESMFPSLMMLGNTGTDTHLGKTTDEGKTYMGKDNKIHTIDPKKHIWLASGAVYQKADDEGNPVESVMRVVVSQLFTQRIKAKHAPAAIYRDIEKLKSML